MVLSIHRMWQGITRIDMTDIEGSLMIDTRRMTSDLGYYFLVS